MQRDARNLDALRRERIQHLRREVQTGCGRGNRTTFARKHRLVALAIGVRIVAANVGRQRHVADAVEYRKEIIDRRKPQHAFAKFAAIEHLRFKFDLAGFRWESESFANGNFLSGLDERPPCILRTGLREQHFN